MKGGMLPFSRCWGLLGRPIATSAAAVAGVTLLLLLALVPIDFLTGAHAFWRNPTGDLAQAMTGAAYFVADRWRWPLLLVPALGPVPGTHIAFTDSIPLVAILARLISAMSGWHVTYLPIWLTLCWLAQGPAMVVALGAAGVRNRAVLTLAGLIAVLLPPFIVRLKHVALSTHFIILLAIALYFSSLGAARPVRHAMAFSVLAALGFLIHPYFGAMVLVVEAMALLDLLWQGRLSPTATGAGLLSTMVVLFAIGALLDYFGSDTFAIRAYGVYALDLATPVVPQNSGLFPEGLLRVREGSDMAYVGAGVLLLCLIGAMMTDWQLMTRAHGGSLFIAGLVIVFAASYGVFVADQLVLGVSPAKVREITLQIVGGGDAIAAIRQWRVACDGVRSIPCTGLATRAQAIR
jgi:Family of unknown function (DUF6311)